MSLRDELTPSPAPSGYTLLVPPDWGRFTADDSGRDQLIALLRDRFAQVGRPDLHAHTRAGVIRQWQRLRSHAAIEIYMPIMPTIKGATPMTLLTAPWIANGPFAEDVRSRAQSSTGVEELDDGDAGTVYRWENERRGEGELSAVMSREITYVRPFPGPNPTRGVMILSSIVHPGVVEAGPALDGFTALSDAIVSTLSWKRS